MPKEVNLFTYCGSSQMKNVPNTAQRVFTPLKAGRHSINSASILKFFRKPLIPLQNRLLTKIP